MNKKKFWSEKNVLTLNILGLKKMLCPKKDFGPEKKFGYKKILGPRKILGQKKVLVNTSYVSQLDVIADFGGVLLVVLVLLVTWVMDP